MSVPPDRPTEALVGASGSSSAPDSDEGGASFVALPRQAVEQPAAQETDAGASFFQARPAPRQAPTDETATFAYPLPGWEEATRLMPLPQAPGVEVGEQVDGVTLEAVALRRTVKDGKVILHDVSLIARPREFIAIVGGSGAGKSTLLGALSGFRPATSGTLLLDGVPLYQNFHALRARIGYVPQDDVIHKELSVERALLYAAELRLPLDWTPEQRSARVDEVIAELGLKEHRKTVVANLSGGQRKRVSIGVELLTRPRLFFLDEPTSGLDPGIETHMMQLLRELADQGRTVLLITHATRNLSQCDKVMFLTSGGRVAYFGTPQGALAYFGVREIDAIYELLEGNRPPESWEAAYLASDFYRQEVAEPLSHVNDNTAVTSLPLQKLSASDERRESWRQFKILTRRYAEIMLRDRKNLAILLLQAPLIALLLWALYASNTFERPNNEWLYIPRVPQWTQPVLLTKDNEKQITQVFDQLKSQQRQEQLRTGVSATPELIFYIGSDCSNPGRQLGRTCGQDAAAGNSRAGKAAQLVFILAAIAVWLGTLNAIREIAKEDAIYRRERMVNLRVLPYLGSKFAVLLGLVLVQSTLLLAVAAVHVGFPGSAVPGIWLSLVLGAIAAVAIALAVSAAFSNPDRAVFAAPMIMLPQILLAGLIVPVSNLGAASPIAALVTSRWAYEAAGRAAGVVDVAAFRPGFSYRDALDGTALFPWLALLGLTGFAAVAGVILQRRKDHV